MPIQEKCRILDHQQIGSRYYKLTLVSKYISSHAQPGQFVQIKCAENFDPLLRRPISFHKISPQHETFELLYEIVGKGTKLLTNYSVGQYLDILGPLGNGFRIDPKKKIHILVSGGIGIAPLYALAQTIKESALYILAGFKTKEYVICENELRKITDQILTATDDGSYGRKGLISELLLDFISNQLTSSELQLTTIYACGPKAMLKVIAEIAFQNKIECQVSMEERMACGIGACLGCAVKTKQGYKMVCENGPIFNANNIIFES